MLARRRLMAVLVNALGFEVIWTLCVLGGSWVAAIAGSTWIALHLRYVGKPGEWRLVAGFALLGLAVDGGLQLAGGLIFGDQRLIAGLLPLWLWMLWPLFATLVHHSLAWLWRWPWLAAALGALGGPLSYFAGAALTDVTLAPWLLPAQALVWALLCLGVCRYYRRWQYRHAATAVR
ncbi:MULTISPECIES: DUF2878 family protein [Halomonadaceae]|jgi:hypothetical protein|uniref:DUF2878 family protein n=1 Tax=Halomonadaceae TaxID=28256 RepID=UPI0018EFC6C1|nr:MULTISPECIES: DUF2878 family protein [Halomonas]MDR5887212.1 DUF2878 family protein [Halomonas janggokensis]QPL46365.1 DUF2878 family protein [Halomonas sp. A40-4]